MILQGKEAGNPGPFFFKEKALKNNKKKKQTVQSYLMLLPNLLGVAVFTVYPILWVFRFCLFRYSGAGSPKYVGLQNFIKIFTKDTAFWQSVLNTFLFAGGKLLVELPLALLLAAILVKGRRGSTFYRTMFYLPAVLSVAVIGIQFAYLFAAYGGVVNGVLETFHIKEFFGDTVPINWFSTKARSMGVLMIASIWQCVGTNMLFFMTGLLTIPEELYESADLDGAGKVAKFFKITLPMLRPVTMIIVMNAILGSLKCTDLVLVLTNGEPQGKTEVMMSYIYKKFFNSGASNYGYASALVIIVSLILAAVAVLYLKVNRQEGDDL